MSWFTNVILLGNPSTHDSQSKNLGARFYGFRNVWRQLTVCFIYPLWQLTSELPRAIYMLTLQKRKLSVMQL